jgi:uncharacterized protein YjbJ (UPF0337 family)
MDENRVEGTVRNAAGKVEEAAGNLTGDARTEARGRARQAAGQAQDLYGQAVDEVQGFAREQPVAALLIAAGVGFLLGAILTRR